MIKRTRMKILVYTTCWISYFETYKVHILKHIKCILSHLNLKITQFFIQWRSGLAFNSGFFLCRGRRRLLKIPLNFLIYIHFGCLLYAIKIFRKNGNENLDSLVNFSLITLLINRKLNESQDTVDLIITVSIWSQSQTSLNIKTCNF